MLSKYGPMVMKWAAAAFENPRNKYYDLGLKLDVTFVAHSKTHFLIQAIQEDGRFEHNTFGATIINHLSYKSLQTISGDDSSVVSVSCAS